MKCRLFDLWELPFKTTQNYCDKKSVKNPNLNWIRTSYYHFRSTLKRDDFFAYVYFSNVTVSQTSVSSGPMKMRCFGRETNNVCQTTVACFVHVAGRFSSFRLYFSSYTLDRLASFRFSDFVENNTDGSRTDKGSL